MQVDCEQRIRIILPTFWGLGWVRSTERDGRDWFLVHVFARHSDGAQCGGVPAIGNLSR